MRPHEIVEAALAPVHRRRHDRHLPGALADEPAVGRQHADDQRGHAQRRHHRDRHRRERGWSGRRAWPVPALLTRQTSLAIVARAEAAARAGEPSPDAGDLIEAAASRRL